MKSTRAITELVGFVETRLGEMGYELVDHRLSGAYGREMLELYCDRMDGSGISVGDCAVVSRRMKPAIEAEGFFKGDFSLIVSSPGLDRVVKKPADFERFIGREIKVHLSKESDGGKLAGRLIGYDDGTLTIGLESGEQEVIGQEQYTLVRLHPDLERFSGKKGKAGKTGKKRN